MAQRAQRVDYRLDDETMALLEARVADAHAAGAAHVTPSMLARAYLHAALGNDKQTAIAREIVVGAAKAQKRLNEAMRQFLDDNMDDLLAHALKR